MLSTEKLALLDRLLAERRISPQQQKAVLAYVQSRGARVEDALVETGTLDEPTLLKWLAAFYKTHFVSTERLAKTEVDRATLGLISRQLAERLGVCPVLFNAKDNSLAFVTADPNHPEVVREVCLVANVPHAKALVARPAAVRAAIHKHYAGDIHAFGKVDRRGDPDLDQLLDTYERNVFDYDELSSARPVPAPLRHPPLPPPARSPREPQDTLKMRTPPTPPAKPSGRAATPVAPAPTAAERTSAAPGVDLEVVHVLMSLLENNRQELRGHSARVMRLLKRVCDEIQVDPPELSALQLAALLHDVGKTSSYHLTALNVAEYEGHRVQAKKTFMSPVRLFGAARLPASCVDALTHMYERFDGHGFPDRRAGKEIPLGARLLALAETYADLTCNAKNPFRKPLSPEAALEVLARYRDSVFDGNLVDIFRVAVLGEGPCAQGEPRARVLLVDADAEEATVLELRLAEQGLEIVACRTAQEGLARARKGHLDLVICEVDLPPDDGFEFVESLRALPHGTSLPVLFLTRRADRAAVDRGFALGAVDYVIKPAGTDVVVAKVHNALARARDKRSPRGVSGSLSEMPLPDVLQVLSRTRKTGVLRVRAAGHGQVEATGEIQLSQGEIHQAHFAGKSGAEAVYALVALLDGEFVLDPTFIPSSRAVFDSTEHLLLEAMRRLDEAASSADGVQGQSGAAPRPTVRSASEDLSRTYLDE